MPITQQELHDNVLRQKYDRNSFRKLFANELFPGSKQYLVAIEVLDDINSKKQLDLADSISMLAEADLGTDRLILVEVKLKQDKTNLYRNRVSLRSLVIELANEITANALMVVFYHPDKDEWRLSYISRITDYTGGTLERKDTHPKRYTYVLGPQERQHLTARDRLFDLVKNPIGSLQKVQEAFSVEKVSKEFFDEYKEHYQDFVQYLTGKRMVKKGTKWEESKLQDPQPWLYSHFEADDPSQQSDVQIEKKARDFCKKLLGRIVFLYFVQKKHWLGATTDKYKDGKEDFMQQLFDQLSEDGRKGFYSDWLSTLFFETLNNPSNDKFKMPNGEILHVPFLNGGLFEKDRIDAKAELVNFPTYLFSNTTGSLRSCFKIDNTPI